MDTGHEVTELLIAWRRGDDRAVDRLFPLVYEELKGAARRRLSAERAGHTLSATALVHEVYLRLVDLRRIEWTDSAHFFAVAARAMRRVLVDFARQHQAAKRRGGEWQRVSLATDHDDIADATAVADARAETLLAIDEALERLAQVDGWLSRVVELRFFGGLTDAEAAAALGMTERTVRRDWVKAKAWLHEALGW